MAPDVKEIATHSFLHALDSLSRLAAIEIEGLQIVTWNILNSDFVRIK